MDGNKIGRLVERLRARGCGIKALCVFVQVRSVRWLLVSIRATVHRELLSTEKKSLIPTCLDPSVMADWWRVTQVGGGSTLQAGRALPIRRLC